jgi:hypothetical protein
LATPSEPFSDFSVGEFGGIDGRQNILYVRAADGVALLISRAPSRRPAERSVTEPAPGTVDVRAIP